MLLRTWLENKIPRVIIIIIAAATFCEYLSCVLNATHALSHLILLVAL